MTTSLDPPHPPHHPLSLAKKLWWFFGIGAVLALLVFAVVEKVIKPPPMPYSGFLDQLDADNVASVVFQGTEIEGRFKHALAQALTTGTADQNTFRSRVPDFGDPAIIGELRKRHVAIDVARPSQWTSWLSGLPWPMLFFLGFALIAGLVRLIRGGKAVAQSATMQSPMMGMIGIISGLFGKPGQSAGQQPQDSDTIKPG